MSVEDMTARLDAENRRKEAMQPVGLDLDQQIPAPRHLIDRILPLNEVTLLGAHGGSGKSILALVLGAHVAAGEDWAGLQVKRARVLYVSLEDSANTITYRMQQILKVYDVSRERVLERFSVIDASEIDAALAVEISDQGVRRVTMTEAFKYVVEAAAGAGLVIIDNASDAFDADENSRRQTRFFIRELRTQIARTNESSVLLLAHIDKMAARHGSHGNSYSGSTAWHNSARSRLALVHDQEGVLQLTHEKANLGPKMESAIDLAWDGPVLVPFSSDPAAAHDAKRLAANEDARAVREYVARMGDHQRRTPANLTGPGNVYVTLTGFFPDLVERFPDNKEGKNRFRAALSKCLLDQTLKEETYKDENRNSRKRLILSHPDE